MNQETIEKYIDGELDTSEILDFESLISSNANLKRDYNLSLEINNSIVEDDVMHLRETLNFLHTEPMVKRLPIKISRRKIYYAAASIAALIAAGGIIHNSTNSPIENKEIYEKYYFPYDANVTYRSGNSELDNIYSNALQMYEAKKFEQALVLFEEVLEKRENDMALNLYSGISYMEKDKYQKASKSFNKIIENNNNLFIEQAKWYLSLCYVITDEDKKAIKLLNEIIEEDSFYKKQAKQVLKEIKN